MNVDEQVSIEYDVKSFRNMGKTDTAGHVLDILLASWFTWWMQWLAVSLAVNDSPFCLAFPTEFVFGYFIDLCISGWLKMKSQRDYDLYFPTC